MSQDALARAAGISASAVYRIERRSADGEGTATVKSLAAIAGALDVPIGALFREEANA